MSKVNGVPIAVLTTAALTLALILALSCGDDPAAPTRDNPLDPGNPETGGDPFGLVAIAEGRGVRLDWVRPEGPAIEGFALLRQDGGAGVFHEKASVSAAVTRWADTTVTDGHAYAYKVIALGSGGARSSSSVVTAVAVLMKPFLRLGTGSQWVSSPVVQLTMMSQTATRMKLGESAELPGDWEEFDPPATWDFSASAARIDGDELRLYAKAGYPDGSESGVVSHAVMLDLEPPVAAIEVVSIVDAVVTVSAARSIDANNTCPAESLQVRWDWDGDGTWDTPYSLEKMASHTYIRPGTKTIRLGVRDAAGNVADAETTITIHAMGEMLWIPAGNVRLGEGSSAHDVMVDGFWIGKYEVTNGEYAAFIAAGGYSTEAYWNPFGWDWRVANNITLPNRWYENTYHGGGIHGNEQFPVNGVSWFEADAYCRWAGGRLPTEAEWEKAAKGPSPNTPTYPWGEGISGQRANYWNSGDPWDNNTTPVGFYDGRLYQGFQTIDSPSPYGLYDVAGNVWEWTSTKYASYPYNANDGRENPPASWNECCRVVRGGSWGSGTPNLRCAYRLGYNPSNRDFILGFRCARTVNPGPFTP